MARGDKGTKRRDSIVDEATKLFAERGYAGASMADLAERVGLRKASLFHHFSSKELLYAAVLERPVKDFEAVMGQALEAKGRTFEERLDDLSTALVEVMGTQPYAARLLVREAMQWTAEEQSPLGAAIDGVMDAAATFVEQGQREGAVPAGDARQLVVSLMGIHVMAFTVPGVVGRFTKTDPFSRAALDGRRAAVIAHARGLILRR
jgi:TetR/AcrR family transcriptional regulator